MRARRILAATVLAGGAFAVGRWSSTSEGRGVDAELFGELNRGHGPGFDRFFMGVTELGSLWAAGGATLTWLAGEGLKRAADRPRPYEADREGTRLLIGRPRAASWPSSHPAVFAAFTTVAARELGLGPSVRAATTGLGLAIAASRVYVGVHYPSDAASGFLLGRAIARLWPGRSRGAR